MYKNNIKEYLDVLELSNIDRLDETTLKKAYLKMSKKYHPDVCEEKYKDGIMFKKVNEANDYLKNNIDTVNEYLKNPCAYQNNTNFNRNNSYTYTYNENDIFSSIFKAYQEQYQRQEKKFTKEEVENMQKERKRHMFKRKLRSMFGLLTGSLMCLLSPTLGIFMILFSLISLF